MPISPPLRADARSEDPGRGLLEETRGVSKTALRNAPAAARPGELVDSLGSLTDTSDRDALAITLTTVLYDLVGATTVILWRVLQTGESTILQECAYLGADARSAWSRRRAGEEKKPVPIEARPHLQSSYVNKTPEALVLGPKGPHCFIFPVNTRRNTAWLVEILSAAPLRPDQERLAHGLLRIFRNHVNVLETGDCDELTGLLNRRTFDDVFARIAAAAPGAKALKAKSRRPHLAVLDIDFFKRVNDHYGHAYGDEVLVLFSRLMTENFAHSAHLFRFGGEEFVVLLAHATPAAALETLERFRAAVSAFAFPQVGQVTVSIGFTAIRRDDAGLDAFSRADAALYLAKERGRNRVFSHDALIESGDLVAQAEKGDDVELF